MLIDADKILSMRLDNGWTQEQFADAMAGVAFPEFAAGAAFEDATAMEAYVGPHYGELRPSDDEAFDLYLDLRSRAGSQSSLPALAEVRGQITSSALQQFQLLLEERE